MINISEDRSKLNPQDLVSAQNWPKVKEILNLLDFQSLEAKRLEVLAAARQPDEQKLKDEFATMRQGVKERIVGGLGYTEKQFSDARMVASLVSAGSAEMPPEE